MSATVWRLQGLRCTGLSDFSILTICMFCAARFVIGSLCCPNSSLCAIGSPAVMLCFWHYFLFPTLTLFRPFGTFSQVYQSPSFKISASLLTFYLFHLRSLCHSYLPHSPPISIFSRFLFVLTLNVILFIASLQFLLSVLFHFRILSLFNCRSLLSYIMPMHV